MCSAKNTELPTSPVMQERWGDQLLNISFDDELVGEFYTLCTEEEMQFMGKKYGSLMELFRSELKVGEKKGNDMYKTFGRGIRSDIENIGHYVVNGFPVLSPLDILCLQDQMGETNWLAYFSKFNEMSQVQGEQALRSRGSSASHTWWRRMLSPSPPMAHANVFPNRADAAVHVESNI